MSSALKRTPLAAAHEAAGAKMVPFFGWEMPLHYGSQLEEHHAVRSAGGIFDVSHMTVVDISGPDATAFLQRLLTQDVATLAPGQASYGALLNEAGGVIDDLIAYRRAEGYRLIVNAATRDEDLAWLEAHRTGAVEITERAELAMLAVQGPQALERATAWLGAAAPALAALPAFAFMEDGDRFLARTGYTGEDGFEVVLPAAEAVDAWATLLAAGLAPAGLGARDTLRLEAGMNLYGQDMDQAVSPLEANMGWTVAWAPEDRAFLGREALAALKAEGVPTRQVGLRLEGKGVLRAGLEVFQEGPGGGWTPVGTLTSGAFSPTLKEGIGLARIKATVPKAANLAVEMRGQYRRVLRCRPPFIKKRS